MGATGEEEKQKKKRKGKGEKKVRYLQKGGVDFSGAERKNREREGEKTRSGGGG